MKNFDEKFRDVPDYILGITREIWEERGVGPALKKYYADNVLVRAANGMLVDNKGVTAATLQTLHEFPDRQLVGEDVIWTGNDEDGYLTSHRLLSVMHQEGSGVYGEATGKEVRSRIIAECWIRDNQVHEEWLARDQAAFANCLGMTPRTLAERQAQQDLRASGEVRFFTPERDVAGVFKPALESGDVADRYATLWQDIWGNKHPAAIRDLYADNAVLYGPGGHEYSGHAAIDRFVIGYLASFPDCEMTIEQLMTNAGESGTTRVAMRWSLQATHCGNGQFDAPGGAPVYIMGLTQAQVVDGKVVAEWLVTDEVAIWKQIIAHDRARYTDPQDE